MYRAYHIIGDACVLFVFTNFGCDGVPKGDDGEEIFNVKHTMYVVVVVYTHIRWIYLYDLVATNSMRCLLINGDILRYLFYDLGDVAFLLPVRGCLG